MLKELGLHDVGPAEALSISFGPRLNVLLGDNSLGKTFLLDVAWWALTRTWAGPIAAPMQKPKARPSISFVFDTTTKSTQEISTYDRSLQSWPRNQGRPPNPGLVVYARVDGGFSVWDPAQNYWRTRSSADDPGRPSAFHFNAQQVWAGFDRDRAGKTYCRGLVEDWGSWQRGRRPTGPRSRSCMPSGPAGCRDPGAPGSRAGPLRRGVSPSRQRVARREPERAAAEAPLA